MCYLIILSNTGARELFFFFFFMTVVWSKDLKFWSFGLDQVGMSLALSRVEWQPLVVQSVFIASSSSPQSVRLGNECNWSFWYQCCVGPRVACGEGFLRSVPHHSLLELVKPRRQDLLGIIKPSSGKWKSDRPKQSCKCFMLWVNWKRPEKTVVIVAFGFLLV